MEFEEKTFKKQHYIYVEGEVPMTDPAAIAHAMGAAFGKAFGFLGQNDITPLSAPISVYTDLPLETLSFRCGFFVSKDDARKAEGDVQSGIIRPCTALHALHVGPYTNLKVTHGAIWAHAKANGRSSTKPVWEIYIDDPEKTNPDELRTEVYHALS